LCPFPAGAVASVSGEVLGRREEHDDRPEVVQATRPGPHGQDRRELHRGAATARRAGVRAVRRWVMLAGMDDAQRAEVVDAWWRGDLSDEDRDELLALQRGDPVADRFVDQLAALHVGGFADWAFEGQPHMGFQNPAWFSEFLDLKRRAP